MNTLGTLKESFDAIFFIASFHHLQTIDERMEVLQSVKKLLSNNGHIFLTNWNLLSSENLQKYANAKIPHSKNTFESEDFMVKIGKFERFYHAFTLSELEFLAEAANMNIVENRIFP